VTFKELIQDADVGEITEAYNSLYDNLNGVAIPSVMKELLSLGVAENTTNMQIMHYVRYWDSGLTVHLCGKDTEIEEGQTWALEYMSWSDWLGYHISQELLDVFGDNLSALIAVIYYEITWNGYTSAEVEEKKKELDAITSQIHCTKENPF